MQQIDINREIVTPLADREGQLCVKLFPSASSIDNGINPAKRLLLPIDILLEMAKYLELPYYHRLRMSCKSLHFLLHAVPTLSFQNFKRHIFLDFDKSKFKLSRPCAALARPSINRSPVILFFLVKQKCVQEFGRWYESDCYTALHKRFILDYCADRCSLEKAEMALLVMVGGKKGLEKLHASSPSGEGTEETITRVRISCSLKTGLQNSDVVASEDGPVPSSPTSFAAPASSTALLDMASLIHQNATGDFLITESELILSDLKDWTRCVASFRHWFKNWYQIAEDATLQLKSFSQVVKSDTHSIISVEPIETIDLLCKPNSRLSSIRSPLSFSSSSCNGLLNPLKADLLFAKAALVEKNIPFCQELYSNPTIAALGERNSFFRIAMDSEVPDIMELFLKDSSQMTLAYHIFKSSNGLDILPLIQSGQFNVEAADNLALEMACRKKFLNVTHLILQSPLVFLSKNWRASPIRILFDHGLLDIIQSIFLEFGIPNTGAELSVFRRCIQRGNLELLKLFLAEKSGRFNPAAGNFRLLRLATKHVSTLETLLKDPRCAKLVLTDLIPQFPMVPFGKEITNVLASFVMNSLSALPEEECKLLQSANISTLCKIACATGHLDIVILLLRNNMSSFTQKVIFQCLDAACYNGQLAIIQFLVDDKCVQPKPGHLLSACAAGHADTVLYFLKNHHLKLQDLLDKDLIQIGIYDEKVNRVLYEYEAKLWASSFQQVLCKKFRISCSNSDIKPVTSSPFKKLRLS